MTPEQAKAKRERLHRNWDDDDDEEFESIVSKVNFVTRFFTNTTRSCHKITNSGYSFRSGSKLSARL